MKRFIPSSLALAFTISAIFALQISLAQTVPNANPPAGNVAANLSGLNVIGNSTFTGFAEFGNSIKPKAPATTLGVAGKLNVTNGLDVTGKVKISDELTVNQFFTASKENLFVNLPAHFGNVVNLNSNVNIKGDVSLPGKLTANGSFIANGSADFPNGAQIGVSGKPDAGILNVLLPATFSNNVTIGDAYVTTLHAKTAGQSITISDPIIFNGDTAFNGVNNSFSSLTSAGKAIFGGGIDVDTLAPKTAGQTINVNGGLTVNNKSAFNGGLVTDTISPKAAVGSLIIGGTGGLTISGGIQNNDNKPLWLNDTDGVNFSGNSFKYAPDGKGSTVAGKMSLENDVKAQNFGDIRRVTSANKLLSIFQGKNDQSVTCPKKYIILSCYGKLSAYSDGSGNTWGKDAIFYNTQVLNSASPNNTPTCTISAYVLKNLAAPVGLSFRAEALCFEPDTFDTASNK